MSLASVSHATEVLKWAGFALTTGAIFLGAWAMSSHPASPIYRHATGYVASLEAKLRPMFIFLDGRWIAYGQCAALGLLLTTRALYTFEFWWVGIVFIALLPRAYIDSLRRQRVEKLEEQLDNFILALANALKTTPSIGAALSSVAAVIPDPMRQEVDLAVKEMKVGSSLEQALLNMASRSGSQRLDAALSAVLIGRQVGGNLPKVLETTASTTREMRRLEGVVRTKTAEGKAQLWVIGLMPFGLLVGLNALWPGYFAPLTSNVVGYIILVVCVACWLTSIILARKVLNVDV